MTGKRAQASVVLASTDRVATDAVRVAVMKSLGSNAAIMKRKIFEQEQIARAAELGLGPASPSDIQMVAGDEKSREYGNSDTREFFIPFSGIGLDWSCKRGPLGRVRIGA
jgi:uncharacterized protein (DUF362 family)